MSAFTALNIIPDEDSDDEVDNTKEIQIEEALKLYTTALKLHSQGASALPQAQDAYAALFQSEIFKYPEALPDFLQSAPPGSEYLPNEYDEENEDENAISPPAAETSIGLDGVPSSLPQILYLCFKNHGQFTLDRLRYAAGAANVERGEDGPHNELSGQDIANAVYAALGLFAEALARDDSDPELWRRTARLGQALGSHRVVRLCLEAVLDDEEDDLIGTPGQMSLEKALAGTQLQKLLQSTEDQLSLKQPPVSLLGKKRISPFLAGNLDPYPFLPDNIQAGIHQSPSTVSPAKYHIEVKVRSWMAIGSTILFQLLSEQNGKIERGSGAPILIELPESGQINRAAVKGKQNGSAASLEPNVTPDENEPTETNAASETALPIRGTLPEAPQEAESASSKPTLKRSSSSAGLQEPADGARVRSKRIRARESHVDNGTAEEKLAEDLARQQNAQLEIFHFADEPLFSSINSILSKLGVEGLGSLEDLRATEASTGSGKDVNSDSTLMGTSISDLQATIANLDDERGRLFLYGDNTRGLAGSVPSSAASRNAGLTAFLEHSKTRSRRTLSRAAGPDDESLVDFVDRVNHDELHLNEAALQWIDSLLLDQRPSESDSGFDPVNGSSYRQHLWPEPLKQVVVQILVYLDESIYARALTRANDLKERTCRRKPDDSASALTYAESAFTEMTQSILELHLDIYASITNPSSKVDQPTRTAQYDRVVRWAILADELINFRCKQIRMAKKHAEDSLEVRYLWASALYAGMSEGVAREHVVLCITDLRKLFQSLGEPTIELQNNAIMPELSSAAAEREISRLTTMDFFLSIFQSQVDDPLLVIESLEPVLEKATILSQPEDTSATGKDTAEEPSGIAPEKADDATNLATIRVDEMSKVLETGPAPLRLFLWKTLQEAYMTINYSPKVMSCYLRSIEVIIAELCSVSYANNTLEYRCTNLLAWLNSLDDLVVKTLTLILSDPSAYDCIDEEHLRVSLSALSRLFKLVHSFLHFEDAVRVGKRRSPGSNDHKAPGNFQVVANRFHEMHVRTIALLYTLFKEGLIQGQATSSDVSSDLVAYLQGAHRATGIRFFCHASNKVLLNFMKIEFLRIGTAEVWEGELPQVLFDLHGLRLVSGNDEVQEHGCPTEKLDRATAGQIMDFVMDLVKRSNIKDISKTKYEGAINLIQGAIGGLTPTSALLQNNRIIWAYLRSSINPLDLYHCLKGLTELSTAPITGENAAIVSKGWYLLMGHMALARFRSQKRVSQTPTTDLDHASYFLNLDLQYSIDNWETWYRLAQTFDTKIEEEILWTADKMNDEKNDLHLLERYAIHSYTMAVSTAIRNADDSPETAIKMSELFTDFGMRVYASSRMPFNMKAFWLHDFSRHYSGADGMYKKEAHAELSLFKTWKFAGVLFKRALATKPTHWINHYMLGKCIWKMYNHRDNVQDGVQLITTAEVIRVLMSAVENLPQRKSERQEPILEPHYKIVSVVHKLLGMKQIQPKDACEILQVSCYARKVTPTEDMDGWDPYILGVLKVLRVADKANWHHRMIARAAHVIYDGNERSPLAAAGARHEFTQQIFTKTMAIQVWKPEFERAGRHFVYTTRYIDLFSKLLFQLNDRAGMEALVKRVRKRSTDFFHHDQVWQNLHHLYVKLIRRSGHIPEGHEDAIFKNINHEEFLERSARLEEWCQLPSTTDGKLDLLRDVLELKRLNNNLAKPTHIDDLLADTYARLYETIAPSLARGPTPAVAIQPALSDERRDMMNLHNLLMSSEGDPAAALQAQQAAGTAQQPGVKHRARGVGRKELLRIAEAAATKSTTTPVAARIGRGSEALRGSVPAAPSPQRPGSAQSKTESGDGREESPPLSVHDSLDEEDGETNASKPQPMFPNLAGEEDGERTEESGAEEPGEDEEVDDDDDDEEQVGEEGQGDEEVEEEDAGEEAEEDEQEEEVQEVDMQAEQDQDDAGEEGGEDQEMANGE